MAADGVRRDAAPRPRCGVYVYYRVARADARRWIEQARALQAAVGERVAGVASSLLRRVDAPDGSSDAGSGGHDGLTLMEVYELAGDDAQARRLAGCVSVEAARWPWPTARHVEVFADVETG